MTPEARAAFDTALMEKRILWLFDLGHNKDIVAQKIKAVFGFKTLREAKDHTDRVLYQRAMKRGAF